MNKLIRDYLCCTFAMMLVWWGLCVICSMNGLSVNQTSLLYIPYMLGVWSPTAASFLVLKKHGQVGSFKDWLKNVFDFRHNIFSYGMTILLPVLFIFTQCMICGYEHGTPLFALPLLIPLMIVCGGLEEAGWRYILQPELEKSFSFTVSTLITGVIWWLWHLPLFYIQGVVQYGQNYFTFGINVLGFSFALAGIRKNTNSVWLCVLFHCLINSISPIFAVQDENIVGNIAASALLIVCTYALLKLNDRKKVFH